MTTQLAMCVGDIHLVQMKNVYLLVTIVIYRSGKMPQRDWMRFEHQPESYRRRRALNSKRRYRRHWSVLSAKTFLIQGFEKHQNLLVRRNLNEEIWCLSAREKLKLSEKDMVCYEDTDELGGHFRVFWKSYSFCSPISLKTFWDVLQTIKMRKAGSQIKWQSIKIFRETGEEVFEKIFARQFVKCFRFLLTGNDTQLLYCSEIEMNATEQNMM